MNEVAKSSAPEVTEHLARQQCSRQWRHFLHALAAEFAAALPPADLRTLSQRIGQRFANELPLQPQPTLEGLEGQLSALWRELDWGWVQLSQQGAQLEIRHFCSPLTAAFGASGVEWAAGFLEGAYQHWFDQQGAPGLKVAQSTETDAWGCVSFRLGR
ncbi:MAG: cellulose synthase [Curvibacter sp.]|nr:cellulose synthase [Curvibacter sp.]